MTYKRIPNPYIVGNPVEDRKMFFGREDDFSYIRTKVSGRGQGGMIVLCGTRRSGKTSILFQILQGRLGNDFLPVLMDLQSINVKNDGEFIGRLAALILETVGDRIPAGAYSPASADFGDVAYAFRFLCRQVREALGGTSLIIMFDEYELFETNIDEGRLTTRVLDLLGETIQGDSGVFFLFTGSDKLEERNADYWSSSLGKSLHRRISFLSRQDAYRLIREPVAGLVEFDDGVPDRLLALGGGQPFYTQVLCQTLVDHLNDKEQNRISDTDVDEVVSEIVDNPLPHMIFTWGDLTDPEKVTLASLGEINREEHAPRRAEDILEFLREEKTGITLPEDVLHESLERMFQNDLLVKEDDGERFSFKMELWRFWILRMHSIWQALDEVFAEGRKPDPGIIRIARRRVKRIGMALFALALASVPFVLQTLKPEEIIIPAAVPDSTYLEVATHPEGARVFVDNYEIGEAPLDSIRVEVGRFSLRFELEGYRSRTDSVEFSIDTLNTIEVGLQELMGGMHVSSSPEGARIRLEGQDTGQVTPADLTLLSTRDLHDIELRLAGYLPARFSNLEVHSDSVVTIHHDFSKRTHPLTIATDPPGARVIFDEKDLGLSPQTMARVTEGNHRIACSAFGYHDLTREIEVPVDGNRLDLDLVRLPPGHLVMRAQPYADMTLAGEQVARAKVFHEVTLQVGDYDIVFTHPHFGSFSQTVTIVSGDTTLVQHDFGGGGR